jgi:hypothetical protein
MSYDSTDSIPDAIVEDLVDINEDFV